MRPSYNAGYRYQNTTMVEREGREYTFATVNFAICESVVL